MNITWTKYFDRIYCIQNSFHKERQKYINSQLQRIGILDSGIFQYSIAYSNTLDRRFNNYLNTTVYFKNIDIPIFISTYNIIKDACYRKYKKILIINDNIKFINEDSINQIFENKSTDADIIIYNKDIDCYQLNTKAMEKMIQLIENDPEDIKTYLTNTEKYLNDLKCTSTKDIVTQVEIAPIERTYSGIVKIAENQNIDLEKEVTPTTLNICFSCTSNHFDKLSLPIYSFKKYTHKDSKLNFYIVIDKDDTDKFEKQLDKFKDERTTFKVVNGSNAISLINVHFNHFHTFMSYVRLLIPTLFPNVDKMLYLDFDTFIGRKGIENLFNLNIDNYYFAGTDDALSWGNGFFCTYDSLYRQSKTFALITKQYISSGVLLINIKKIIKDKKDEEIIQFLKGEPPSNFNNRKMFSIWAEIQSRRLTPSITTFQLCDQSVINWLFVNNKKIVSPIFNNLTCFPNNVCYENEVRQRWGFENLQDLFNKTIVFHLNELKPWELCPENKFKLNQFTRKAVQKYNDIKKEMEEVLK